MTWTALTYSFGSVLTSAKMTQNQDNFAAVMAKDAGAPVLANSYVVEAIIANSAVAQAKLKTAQQDITVSGIGDNYLGTVLTGGQYCFNVTTSMNAGSSTDKVGAVLMSAVFAAVSPTAWNAGVLGTAVAATFSIARSSETAWVAIYYDTDDGAHVLIRYITASPPYNPFGLGVHPLFVYAIRDKVTGKIIAVSTSEDPPWANNGPTAVNPMTRMNRIANLPDIFKTKEGLSQTEIDNYFTTLKAIDALPLKERLLLENRPIDQDIKNADMDLIPQPFMTVKPDQQVLLLAGPVVEDLWMRQMYAGDSIGDILINNHLIIDNAPIPGATKYPLDTLLCSARFKVT